VSTRDAMLERIRAAVAAGAPATPDGPVPRDYHRTGTHPAGSDHVRELLVDRLVDYKAEVTVVTAMALAAAVDTALADARSVVIPAGLDEAAVAGCRSSGRLVTVDGRPAPLSAAELDGTDAAVTGATVAIAVTGTIVLSAQEHEGRRAISLVPDLLVVVLTVDQIVETVPDGMARLSPTRALTMISGPSATSDIELSRVEGVHGPRTLRVLIVDGPVVS
jgi:L-lactate dehydrogenase complex protein LldG